MAEADETLTDQSGLPYAPQGAAAFACAADFERALLALWGMAPAPAPTERQLAEWQERWEELMQDPAIHRITLPGVSVEDMDRRAWERDVQIKLDSALFALANGWPYDWNQPYEYDIPETPS